jgi:VRR-NUC domain
MEAQPRRQILVIQFTLHYPADLLKDWKSGRIHRKWYEEDMGTFCERDLQNADGQCRKGYHFGEWFAVRHFRKQGYEVLPPKYLHPTRERSVRKATTELGEPAVAFLMQKRKFGTELRKSPRPDLLVFNLNPKIFFFVEVKRDTDRLSSAQRQFFPMIEKMLGCEVQIANVKVLA